IRSYGGKAVGRGSRVNVGGDFAFVGGIWTPGATDPTANDKVPQATGISAFAFYSTNSSQTDDHGANADYSAILGGLNHNIPSDSPRSVILGGSAIKARATDPDNVYVPYFNITKIDQDDTLTQVLVRDSSTGKIKYRSADTLG